LQREVETFEAEFARYLGTSYAVAVSSGTGALNTALSALGAGPGQEIIIPAYMWVSVAAAVVNHGAIPVVVDIDETFGLDPGEVETHITNRTKGIIVVHMSGASADIKRVQSIARDRGLFLIRRLCPVRGGSVNGQEVGTFGDMGVFSFQMNKKMTCGEGGCVVTNDFELYRRAFACHDMVYPRDEKGRLVFDIPGLRLWGQRIPN
jgi:dTDP-4-amino-4,6-dideoxygalactose transaminase